MNIRDELLKEHSLANTRKIVNFACASEENFEQLMQCFLCQEYRVAQRASWAVSHVASRLPSFINPYIKDLVDQLSKKEVHNAVIRNSVRILQQVEIPEECHGQVLNACFAFIESHDTPIAIKAFSLTTLHNLSKFYPEIKGELTLIIKERWDLETPAFKSRAKKILGLKN
ncbi:hypothetical protein [Segetibacter aerophilus]|uniref:Adenylosuccinate lyase n=1 Tax=Segetibacter aerophilus TaxID=670293 RepID=A0A512BJA7_9BACT|nr:hypothetical protein [Segetibacter aerophilus]GEO12048.1 hypothetical protein SAE01_45440 [Segetibacter aerophilus]